MENSDILYVLATFLLAGFVKGFCGLGFATVSIGILATFLDLTLAIPLTAIPSIASSFFVMVEAGHFRQALKANAVLYIALLPGLAIGIAVLVLPEANIAKSALGLLLLVYGIWGLLNPSFELSESVSRRLRIPIGFLTGTACGLTGVAVVPMIPYFLSVGLSPTFFVQSANIAFVICTTILLISLGSLGYIPAIAWIIAIVSIIPVAIAVRGGALLRRRASDRVFRVLVLAVLIILGANLMMPTSPGA